MPRPPIHRIFAIWQHCIRALRSRFWRLLLRGSKRLKVFGPIWIHHPENVSLGDDCTLNHWCVLNARAPLTIGHRVRISAGAMITTAGLETTINPESVRQHHTAAIMIGDDVWIGAGAIVLPGVTIGARTVVGAGAVVARDLPPDVVAVGMPAAPLPKKA